MKNFGAFQRLLTDSWADSWAGWHLYCTICICKYEEEKKIGSLCEKIENRCSNLVLIHATNLIASVLAYLDTSCHTKNYKEKTLCYYLPPR